jgi:hypothetical protein
MAVNSNIFYSNGPDLINGGSVTFTYNINMDGDISDMTTSVYRLAAGYVGVVITKIDGSSVPLADTKPRKTEEDARKAAKKLAEKIARRGL